MKILHLLTSGEAGGIESLCRDIGRYSKFENTFCFLSSGGAIHDQMKEMGLLVYDLFDIGGKFSLRKYKRIKKMANEHDIVVVHHGDPYLKLYYCLLHNRVSSKFVSIIHSCYTPATCKHFQRVKRVIYDFLINKSLSVSDALIFVANAGRKSFIERFGEKNVRTYVVYNGISEDILRDGMKNCRSEELPINITYIGRLNIIKGVENLLRAVEIIRNKFSVEVSIIGDGPDRDRLQTLTNELNINDIVTFYGQQTNVGKYLKKASIFVYPSICPEVFGISLVEAMAYGIPCISNKVGGIPEVIEDGKSGLLCESFNPSELAQKIEVIISQDATNIISEGRKVAQKFSITNTVTNLQKVFEEILG